MLQKILLEETDEQHPLTMPEIISRLKNCGIDSERKSIYRDLQELSDFGLDIISEQREKRFVYYIGSREFELAEVKLLADAVASARFISEKKSSELIRKLGKLTSREDAKQLNREVLASGRVKAENESVFYNVDSIHTAIGQNRKIRFQYFQWNRKKEQELRHGGMFYEVSPLALIWDDEYYYLLAYDPETGRERKESEEKAGKLKHFRVDKMLKLSLLPEKRDGEERYGKLDLAGYTKKHFNMFSGTEERVSLEAENRYAGILIDHFGKNIFLYPKDEEHLKASVDVAVSEQFFSWVFSLGPGIRITGPEKVLASLKETVERLSDQYLREETEENRGNKNI